MVEVRGVLGRPAHPKSGVMAGSGKRRARSSRGTRCDQSASAAAFLLRLAGHTPPLPARCTLLSTAMPADHAEEIALEEKVALLEPDADVLREADPDDADSRPPRRRRLPWLLALGVALALALALALGYRVTHPRCPQLPTELQPSRYKNFVLDGLRGQPPQTREHDFVVSQV